MNEDFSSLKLKKIDSIVDFAIKNKMTPGVQLLIAKNGSVIYNKSYGHHTYNKKISVENEDIYDLASITKILVSLPLIIREIELKSLTFDSSLSSFFPKINLFEKRNIKLKEMLSHYSRLTPWIPFYKETLDSVTNMQLDSYYSNKKTSDFNIEVREGLYMQLWDDIIFDKIIKSELLESKEYKYSDLPYYLIKKHLEDKYGKSLDKLIRDYIFSKNGMLSLNFNPYKTIDLNKIVPSEIDDYFRLGELRGYVHDMGAAMQGGIGGHAGLFGNSLDVAKMMQLYIQKGFYGDKKFFSKKIFDEFNKCHFCDEGVRRGIGFDKPELYDKENLSCECLSEESFGHSGFTGTYTWADPENQIIYVFLSNRTYPSMENRKLIDYNIRTEIKKIIFE